MNQLPTCKVHEISDCPDGLPWLIEGLWLDNGVGIIGGEPKSFKTFAALSLAVAVSSGEPCFGRYAVKRCGPVLLYAAEDSLQMVKERIRGIANKMGVDFKELNIDVITAPQLRIDSQIDRKKIEHAITDLGPVLLILDPFVRLHRIDENSAGEVAKILSWLRDLQRQFNLNVAMVHHARKRAGKERPGQSLRGSSELHAWGDSNLYFRRATGENNYVEMSIEHRAAASADGISLQLEISSDHVCLTFASESSPSINEEPSPQNRIEAVMAAKATPMTGDEIRGKCRMKSSTFWSELNQMTANNQIQKLDSGGYQLLPSLSP